MSGNREREEMSLRCPECESKKFINDMVPINVKGELYVFYPKAGVFRTRRNDKVEVEDDVSTHISNVDMCWICRRCSFVARGTNILREQLNDYVKKVMADEMLVIHWNIKDVPKGF